MSAESNMVRPASRQMSTSRVASATSLAPHALNNSPPPPNVPVPKLSAGTFNPEPPSWRFLGLMGLIGGAPTFVGTVIGHSWTSENLSILFFALAAGSILYVVMELLNVCRTFGSKSLTAWGIVLGLTLGFATDFVLVAAGV